MQRVEAPSNFLLVIHMYLASNAWKSNVGQFDWKSDV